VPPAAFRDIIKLARHGQRQLERKKYGILLLSGGDVAQLLLMSSERSGDAQRHGRQAVS